MIRVLEDVVKHAKNWPKKAREELLEHARALDARRGGVYILSDDERAAVRKGRGQARRGKFVSEKKMRAFWKKHGVV